MEHEQDDEHEARHKLRQHRAGAGGT